LKKVTNKFLQGVANKHTHIAEFCQTRNAFLQGVNTPSLSYGRGNNTRCNKTRVSAHGI